MNVEKLLRKLEQEEIPSRWYSINGNLATDTYMLRKVHDYWEFFYVDERGNQDNDYRRFYDESEACYYLYNKLINEKIISLNDMSIL